MNSALLTALRKDLDAANFTVDGLNALWGESADRALHRGQRRPAQRALENRASSPRAVLASLFVLGVPVTVIECRDALPTLGVSGALELGLVSVQGATVCASVDLRPYAFTDTRGSAQWWIVSDLGELALGHELPEDHVLGVGGASLTLARLMLQSTVSSVLDVGTGCGIQALHASRHAARVVATDISKRALHWAALNAELNEISTIEFRHGNLFDPVIGEQFDRIVSNPPFVITPRVGGVPEYEYRDGGMVGDALVNAFVRRCGEHLTSGGVAQLLGNWEYRAGEEGLNRVQQWVEASGVPLDAWVIEREVSDCVEYAETWIRDGGITDLTAKERLLDVWLDDFESRRVEAVGFGYLLLRRTTDTPTLRRYERLTGALGNHDTGLGTAVADAIAAHDALCRMSDDELGRLCLEHASDVTEERHFWPGSDDPTVILLRQGGAFGRVVSVSTELAAFVGACDGELSVEAICVALAQLMDVPEGELNGHLLPRVRALIEDGVLTLPGSADFPDQLTNTLPSQDRADSTDATR